ncbi:UNVERIFIED_CONTAM: hypothetical protein Scaly_3036400 [Sesamum calycinum]|uniref:Reverse transcriptase domain-containing protein n=1 Tax=Sesamum calycinum TaxID=2727403 RepID=A0AAW2K7F2_9LAMI
MPSQVSDYRPIACCNVLYKTITKIIVKRMQLILHLLIDYSQNAFVPGRSISDNILLAQELLAGYNQAKLPPRCTIKVDLKKAYDSVEWDFLIEAHIPSATVIKDTLCKFSVLSGLNVNPAKSHIILSRAAQQNKQQLLELQDFRKDIWHENGPLCLSYPRGSTITGLPLDAALSCVLQNGQWHWPSQTDQDISEIAARLPPVHQNKPDSITWRNKSGNFTVQSAVLLIQPPSPHVIWHVLLHGASQFYIVRYDFNGHISVGNKESHGLVNDGEATTSFMPHHGRFWQHWFIICGLNVIIEDSMQQQLQRKH